MGQEGKKIEEDRRKALIISLYGEHRKFLLYFFFLWEMLPIFYEII